MLQMNMERLQFMRYTKVVKFFASSMPMLRINVKILLFICQVTKYGYKDNVQILTKIANAWIFFFEFEISQENKKREII